MPLNWFPILQISVHSHSSIPYVCHPLMPGISCWTTWFRVRMWEYRCLVRKGWRDSVSVEGWASSRRSTNHSSAVHNTRTAFRRWGLWEQNHTTVGRGVWGSHGALCIPLGEGWERNSLCVALDVEIFKGEHSNKGEENTWEREGILLVCLFLRAHLSRCDPKQKALALTQNGLFPCCQNASFCWCYLLLHGSFKGWNDREFSPAVYDC